MLTLTVYSYLLVSWVVSKKPSNFSKTVMSPYYVDKTLFIKDFITSGYSAEVKIITAPTKCGKSTIIDMVKRFLSIPVDENGNTVAPNSTDNYRLFCSRPLEVCKDKAFVAKHFGQHPLLHVDYSPLSRMTNFSTFVELFRTIVQTAFREHSYMLRNPTAWLKESEKARFIKHYDDEQSRTLTINDMVHAFAWLSKLLSKYFHGKEVMILVDEYDVHFRTVLFSNVSDWDPMLTYMETIFRSFLVYNQDMNVALLTGMLRMYETETEPDEYIHDYRWLGGHIFTKYYGLNEDEIVQLIKKNVEDVRLHQDTLEKIRLFYDGYVVMDRNTKLYSIWSVVNYFENFLTGGRYWIEVSYFDRLMPALFDKSKTIRKEFKRLVNSRVPLEADITEPLFDVDIEEMKEMLETGIGIDREMFYYLMFELGFLSTSIGAANDTNTFSLHIPTYEIRNEFVELLQEYEADPSVIDK